LQIRADASSNTYIFYDSIMYHSVLISGWMNVFFYFDRRAARKKREDVNRDATLSRSVINSHSEFRSF
jgi:hypothetical protein